MNTDKKKLLVKTARLILKTVMILFFASSLLGTYIDIKLGYWPDSIPTLLVGSAYFILKFTDRAYRSRLPRLNKLLKLGFWLSLAAMAVYVIVLWTPWGIYFFESKIITYIFFVWAIFYAAIILEALAIFLPMFLHFPGNIQRKYIIITTAILSMILIPLAIVEIRSEQDVNRLKTAIDEIEQKKLLPAGAVPYAYQDRVRLFYRKDGILGRADCDYVHPCPTGGGNWLLLMSKSKSARHDFAVSALESLGYTHNDASDGSVGGAKNGVGLTLSITDDKEAKPPYAPPKGRIWQSVFVGVELLNQTGVSNGSAPQTKQIAPQLNKYVSKNNHFSFSYPLKWALENNSSPTAETLLLKSSDGNFGLQRSGEPMATSGEVIRINVTPCSSGRACSLDGVYDGVYGHSIHGAQIQLDDATLYSEFTFEYKGELATVYNIFFRDGNKYIFTFNVAGEDWNQLLFNQDVDGVLRPLMDSIRFDD